MQYLDDAASVYTTLVLVQSASGFTDCIGTIGSIEDWSEEQLEELTNRAKDVSW